MPQIVEKISEDSDVDVEVRKASNMMYIWRLMILHSWA